MVVLDQLIVDGEYTSQSTPFCGHVRNRQSFIDAQAFYAGSHKLNGSVQDIVLVKITTESYNHVFAGDPGRKLACELDLDDLGDLPPCPLSGPYRAVKILKRSARWYKKCLPWEKSGIGVEIQIESDVIVV